MTDDQLHDIVNDAIEKGGVSYTIIGAPVDVVHGVRHFLQPWGLDLQLHHLSDKSQPPIFMAIPSSGILDGPISWERTSFRRVMYFFAATAVLVIIASFLHWSSTLITSLTTVMMVSAFLGIRSHRELEQLRKLQAALKRKGFE